MRPVSTLVFSGTKWSMMSMARRLSDFTEARHLALLARLRSRAAREFQFSCGLVVCTACATLVVLRFRVLWQALHAGVVAALRGLEVAQWVVALLELQ